MSEPFDRRSSPEPQADRDSEVVARAGALSDDLDILDALLDDEGVAPAGAIPRLGRKIAPLAPAQRRLAFLHALDPDSTAYTISGAVRLQGALDADALTGAFDAVVARHASLRTTFETRDGEDAVQVVHETMSVPVERLKGVGGTPAAEAASAAKRLLGDPWDLAAGPLLRAAIVTLGRDDHLLVLVMHHIVTDGWSTGIFLRELGALYMARREARAPRLAELPIEYTDYAAWLREEPESEAARASLAYWREHLAGAPEALDLPVDRPRPSNRAQHGALLAFAVPADLTRGLEALAQRHGATLFMVLLAAYQSLLSRWSGQKDIVVGVPVAGRDRAGTEPLIGLFVNTLALRTDLSGDPAFDELLARVRTTALGAYANQGTPFERLVEELRPERSLGRMPLFQAMLAYQDAPMIEELALPGIATSAIEIDTGSAQFDLSLNLQMEDGVLAGSAEYDTDLFDAGTIGRMLAHFRRLLEAIAVRSGDRLSTISLLDPVERETALSAWSGRAAVRTGERFFHERFEEQARAHPEYVAAVLGERRATYGAIDDLSARLAARLVARGAGPETRVGLCLPRGPDLPIGMLAVLRAGAAFVPLDPVHPRDRLAFVCADARVGTVLATGETASLVGGEGIEILRIDEGAAFADEPLRTLRRPAPTSLAYVIYTSGTTGRPKGVMVEQGSLAAALEAWDRIYDLSALRSHLQMAGLGFDVCAGDIVRALGSGGTLVFCDRGILLDPARLFDLARRERIEFAEFVPAVLRELATEARARGERLDDVRIAVAGSDSWSTAEIESFGSIFGARTRLANSYGVTEATIDSSLEFVTAGDAAVAASPPIGRPLTHTTIHVLDGALEPVPAGVGGEIYLGGPAVARGYDGRPDATAERFVPDPFGPPGSRLYRTGDRARYLADGRIVFAGRDDDQLKIRGQRIEPAEVEAAIIAEGVGRVSACVVAARQDASGSARLVAYIVPGRGAVLDTGDLRLGLESRLTAAMVPSAFVTLAALPLTHQGKVDRRRLPEPKWESQDAFQAPRTAAEKAVAAAFSDVLGLARVGAHDDFFALGGHSLVATRVVSRLRSALGVEVPLRTIFEAPRVGDLASRVESLQGVNVPPPMRRAAEADRRDLSYAQRRLWFLDRLEPGSAAYNLPATLSLDGELDVLALSRALTEIVRRHEMLRTRFVETEDGPVQAIDPPCAVALPVMDLSGLAEEDARREATRIEEDEARAPFDLAQGPLMRARLVRLAPRRHRLLFTAHHSAFDAWSTAVFVRETASLYGAFAEGKPPSLPELPIQYADWAAWQRGWLDGDAHQAQLAWWRRALRGAPLLALPSERPRPARMAGPGEAIPLFLDAPLRERLERLGRSEGATLHVMLLAAYAAVLGRWSGQKDVTVGTPVANRRAQEIEPLIGFFVNTLAMRVDLSASVEAPAALTFRSLVARVREVSLGALSNQDVPFERIVEELDPVRRPGHNPLFQALFALQNVPIPEVSLPGLTLVYDEPETGVVRFDVELVLEETREGAVAGSVHYRADMFDRASIERFAENLLAFIDRVSREPDRALADLPLLSPDQSRLVSALGTAAARAYPGEPLVHSAFERQAARKPAAAAARMGEARLTYGQLNARANRLARCLRERGIGPEALVAICVERSFDMLVALLGVLKVGAAFVPVDPNYPAERIGWILEDSRAPLVITQSALEARLPASSLLSLDAAVDPLAVYGEEDPGFPVPADALAYTVYTSGSTGRPKGVAMSHRAIMNMLQWQALDSAPGPDAGAPRTLQFASLSFDVSTQEIFSTLAGGGELVLVSEDERRDATRLLRLIAENRVERLFLPFVALDQIAGAAASEGIITASLREIATAGEQLRITPAIAAFFARLPQCRLVNHYGPSEAHLVTTFELTGDPARWEALPSIGRPIANASVHLLDDDGHPVPLGAPGELCVGGAGLARGYYGRADLTAERFVPSPLQDEPGARLYRTGDIARLGADGNLVFLGRRDLQVKIRGYRVEPGEIESALVSHPAVRQAAVVAREARGGKRLAAYVVLDPPAASSEAGASVASALRAHLASSLPEYMLPAAIVVQSALPLTPNGKVDRAALPEPEWGAAESGAQPRTPEEELVCGIFAEVLGLQRAGAGDDFFELGGHSLLATQVVSRVRRALGVELPLRVLFETPTPAAIAAEAAVLLRRGAPAPPPLRPADAGARKRPSFAQMRLWFLHALDPSSAVYNLPAAMRIDGRIDTEALARVLATLVHRHEALRTRFVQGPDGPEAVIDEAPASVEPVGGGAAFASVAGPITTASGRVIIEDLRPRPGESAADTLARVLREEATRPFDLEVGPVLRVRLLRLGPETHVLSLVAHHIAADGWSLGILVREMGELYEAFAAGLPIPLAPPSVTYADWAAWQRAWLAEGEEARQLAWWREELRGAPPALTLPPDRARPARLEGRGGTLVVRLAAPLVARLSALARAEGATLHMTLLAAYAWTLLRHAGQEEIVVGTPVANRRAAEAEELIGFFVNTLAVRVRAGGSALDFRGLLARVREASLGAFANQDVPFERVVEEIQPERALNRAPLFQTAFALQNARLPRIALSGLTMTPVEVDTSTSKFDLMLLVEETEQGGIEGAFEYSTELFDRSSIAAIATRLERVLEEAVAAPDAPLSALPLAGPDDESRVLAMGNAVMGSAARHEGGGSVLAARDAERETAHELLPARIARAIARTPHAPAIAGAAGVFTYEELGARAGRLALALAARGAGPERRVAVLLERSPEAIVAMLAVLKAGAVWVPLDPTQPAERLRSLIEDCGASIVIATSREAAFLEPRPDAAVILIDARTAGTEGTDDSGDRAGANTGAPLDGTPAAAQVPLPESLAYIIYTSGSTGRPKGVGVEHRQLASYTDAAIARLGIEPGLRYALVSTLAADLGHTSIFPALATGGCLDILPKDIAFDAPAAEHWFSRSPIDVLKIVPSHLEALLGGPHPERVMPRRLLVLGGEATPGKRLESLAGLAPPGCRIAIHYGPTEATVGAVCGFPNAADAARASAPLGRPLAGARILVLDGRGRPVPEGVPGEVFLGGACVARGYPGRPDLTAERFLPDPFAAEPGARLYRTGDRARWLGDGRLEFLGRSDGQVKVRGWRIETGEVAAVLESAEGVRKAAVVVREDHGSGPGLAAYVVADPRVAPVVHGLVRRALPQGVAVAELNRNETDYLHREIFGLRAYTRNGITIRPEDTIVDAGANIGLFSVFAALAAPGARLFACEPNPVLQPILGANLAAYAPGAVLIPSGLSDRAKSAAFTFFPGFSLLSGIYADAEAEKAVVRAFLENLEREGEAAAGHLARESEGLLAERFSGRTMEVPLRSLSEVMAEHGIERIHLLKVNVEKAELDLLRGIAGGDWERIDQAVVEVDVAESFDPILALFAAHGFETHIEQDPLLARTDLRYVYAARRGSGRALVPGAPPPPAPPAPPPLLSAEALRAHARRTLPEAMVPFTWTFLDALPLTPNGKLDRGRLPEPRREGGAFAPPRGEIEKAIASIWAEALGLTRAGVHDNFFDLGGHSLLLARVHARLRETLGAEISIVELFRYPTIESLARRLSAGQGQGVSGPPTRLAGPDAAARGALRREKARERARPRSSGSPGGGGA